MEKTDAALDIVATRREQLRLWIAARHDGSQVGFIAACAAMGHEINQGELSGLLKLKSFGEKKARKLELMAGMPIGYLDGHSGLGTYAATERRFNPQHSVSDNVSVAFPRQRWDKWTQEAIDIFAKLNESQRAACVVNLRAYVEAIGPPRVGQAL